MDDKSLKKAFRNAWILALLGAIFAAGFVMLAIGTNHPPKKPTWDMGGVSFVPAASKYGNGYYAPVEPSEKGE